MGPPTIFLTLTSAEYDWINLMENILKSKLDYEDIFDIVKNMKHKEKLQHLLCLENRESIRTFVKEIVMNMEGSEMSRLVNDHIVNTTVDFDH